MLSVDASHATLSTAHAPTSTVNAAPSPSHERPASGSPAAITGHSVGQRAPTTPEQKVFHLPTQTIVALAPNTPPAVSPAPQHTQTAVTAHPAPLVSQKPAHDDWIYLLIILILAAILIGIVFHAPRASVRFVAACMRGLWWAAKCLVIFAARMPRAGLWTMIEVGRSVGHENPFPRSTEPTQTIQLPRVLTVRRPPRSSMGRARG